MLPPDVISEGCTPEHDEVVHVEEKWNLTKANSWKKFGTEVADIIERSKIYGEARLRIKTKEKA